MKENESVLFNLNSWVKVKLNERGYEILVEWYSNMPEKYNQTIFRFKRREDENGYYPFQMWQIMQIFGAALGMGKENPFDLDIKIETKYLREIKLANPVLKKLIMGKIEDALTDFTYYRRKEDEELSADQLNNAVKEGVITVDEMVEEFRKHLNDTFNS